YIPTNVISITDGQIFLDTGLFNAGIRPAVNVGTSVSRVGGQAQIPAMRKISGRLRIDLAQFREKQSFALFSSELDKETMVQIKRGKVLTEVMKQVNYAPLSIEEQVIMLYLATNGFLDSIPENRIKTLEAKFMGIIRREKPELLSEINTKKTFSPEWEKALGELFLAHKEKI
ncbi:MAG: F0F1 ATP synthase subunit alpha, partial [Candidatus Margulisiibacteriota bacterium]